MRRHSPILSLFGLALLLPVPLAAYAHWAMEPWTVAIGVLDGDRPGVDGTMVGFPGDGTEWVPGHLGRALELDGVGTWVELSETTAGLVPGRSIHHWVRPDSAADPQVLYYESDAPGSGGTYDGFGLGAADGLEIHTGILDGEFFALYQDGTGDPNVPGSGRRQVQGGVVRPGHWTHVAVLWDFDGDLSLYVDCELVDSVPMSDANFAGHDTTETFLGRPSAPGIRLFDGRIDDLAVWDLGSTPASCYRTEAESGRWTAPTQTPGARFGRRIAAGGGMLAVASSDEVFLYSGSPSSGWDLTKTLSGADGPSLDSELALVGTTLVVSHPSDRVALYERDLGGVDNWGLLAVVLPEFDDLGEFAASFDLHGDLLVVGSPEAEAGGSYYVFERDLGGAGAWGRSHRQTTTTFEDFGRRVEVQDEASASDDLVVIAEAFGQIRFFRRDAGAPGTWGLVQTIDLPRTPFDFDLLDDELLVERNSAGVPSGITVYRRDLGGPEAWGAESGFLEPPDDDPYDDVGDAIWVREDLIAMSSLFAEPEGIYYPDADHSAIYLYRRSGSGSWTAETLVLLPTVFDPLHEISPPEFGRSLAVVGDFVLAGAPLNGRVVDGAATGPAVDAGRVVEFAVPFFLDGFESGDTSAWTP